MKLKSPKKEFITNQEMLMDSFRVGRQVYESGFHPTFLIALWRGGTPVGMAITEYFRYKDQPIKNHFAVSTRAYHYQSVQDNVEIFGLNEIAQKIKKTDKVLLVDDLIDTGTTIKAVLKEMKKICGDNLPDKENIKIATVYCKPKKTDLRPDFYLHETDAWLVFPHEIEGLTQDEIVETMGKELAEILS